MMGDYVVLFLVVNEVGFQIRGSQRKGFSLLEVGCWGVEGL